MGAKRKAQHAQCHQEGLLSEMIKTSLVAAFDSRQPDMQLLLCPAIFLVLLLEAEVATFEAWLGNRARGSKQLYTAPTGSFSQPIEGKPDFSSETDTITVGLEVYSNLMLGLR